MFNNNFKDKKILITGNTGFKGSWLSIWLIQLGAKVYGISNDIPTKPSMFEKLKLKEKISHFNVDVRNYSDVKKIINDIKPKFIFHMAAQPLVVKSYQDPLQTISTNVIGSANILENVRNSNYVKSLIYVTSDKV